jgi:hypothetical protein
MSSITLNPRGGHFGEGEGAIGFFFFLVAGFFVGVAFLVGLALAVGVAVAFTVADADADAEGVGVGVDVAATPCAGTSARQSPKTNAARFIDHSI